MVWSIFLARLKFKGFQDQSYGFDPLPSPTINKKGTVARWTDDENGIEIVLKGKNFDFGSSSDVIGTGRATSVELFIGDEKLSFSVADFSMKAVNIAAHLGGTLDNLVRAVASGDDRVIGSKGAEYLIGGAGNDVMTGGKGSDYFEFHALTDDSSSIKAEHDVITDFQWRGPNKDDLQYVGDFEVTKANRGQDALITFTEYGSTLLLEDVTRKQFLEWANG
jgi:Ca2+-binding RTX toxin-like protein